MSMLINNDLFKFFESDNVENYTYDPYDGINEYVLTSYSEHIHKQAIIFFKILEKFKLEYVVFAGSSVGMVRNKCMMPWTDDYDIIVLDKYKKTFFNEIMPVLKTYGFRFWGCGTDKRGDEIGWTFGSGVYTRPHIAFRIDIFWSRINDNNIIENVDRKGLYHRKKLSTDIFFPPKYISFNEIILPFSNQYEKEVELTYGDVENNCVVYSHSILRKGEKVYYKNWKDAIQDFKKLKEKAIENTKNLININNYKPDNKILFLDDTEYSNTLNLLRIIVKENIKTINCINFEKFMRVSGCILFYFPEIKINLFIYNLKDIKFFYLNYATNVYVYDEKMKSILDDLEYINKPIIDITKKIGYAVGVFDLFHYGHQNFLLECVKRCDKLIIGIHTDDFVESYKRKPIENEKLREKNILSFIKDKNIDYETCIIDDNHIKLIDEYDINIIFHGTDWELESYKKQIKYYEFQMDKRNIKIELIDYTRGISTTDIINKKINKVNKKKCFLFDLDNTLLLNNKPMKCACELLKKLNEDNKDIYLITNNNRYSPEDIYENIITNNLNIKYENVISSLIQVKNYLIKEKLLNIYLWGTDSAKIYLEKNGIKCKSFTDKNIDIVVILYKNNFNYDELSKLCTVVKHKNYIAGNIDPCYPDKNYILPDTGSIIKLIQNTSNNKPLKIFGKPDPLIISSIKEKYTNEEILFIGDSEITDKKLAINCNIDFLRVHKEGDIYDLGVLLYILNQNDA